MSANRPNQIDLVVNLKSARLSLEVSVTLLALDGEDQVKIGLLPNAGLGMSAFPPLMSATRTPVVA
jgi:hypothetical protein